MALHRINVEVELSEINCGNCSGTYAINERYRKQKETVGGYWNCPYCQSNWGYGKDNLNSRLQKELEEERSRKAAALARANEATAAQLKAERALKRHKTRAKNGVCPCCNRTFVALAQHIKNQHPDYAP